MRKYLLLVVSVCCVVICMSCTSNRPQVDDTQVFRYNEIAEITSLDPAFARAQSNIWVCRQLYSGLVQLGDDMEVLPDLARAWEISDDGLTYRFTLRDDVWFHEDPAFGAKGSRMVSAQDVVYSLERLRAPNLAAPGAWTLKNVAGITAIGTHEVEIVLKQAFPPFLGLLSMQYCSVLAPEAVEHYGADFRSHPVGSGPFYLKYWKENNKLVLRRNAKYFEKDAEGASLPYLEAVAISFIPDKQTAFLEFLQGNIDFISGLDPSYTDEVLTADGQLQERYTGQIQMLSTPYLNTEYLGIQQELDADHPLADLRIRQAINHGFDRAKMMRYLRKNMGYPAEGGMIPVGLPGHLEEAYSYQPVKARALLADYVAEKGDIAPFTLQTNSSYVDLCEFIQAELQSIGLPLSVEVLPPATLRQAMATGKAPFFRASWIADYPDAENYLSLFYSPNKSPNGPNYTRFHSDSLDVLYEGAVGINDLKQRSLRYRSMDSLIMAQAPVVPLYYDKAIRFVAPNVEGLQPNAINLLTLKRVRKR